MFKPREEFFGNTRKPLPLFAALQLCSFAALQLCSFAALQLC